MFETMVNSAFPFIGYSFSRITTEHTCSDDFRRFVPSPLGSTDRDLARREAPRGSALCRARIRVGCPHTPSEPPAIKFYEKCFRELLQNFLLFQTNLCHVVELGDTRQEVHCSLPLFIIDLNEGQIDIMCWTYLHAAMD